MCLAGYTARFRTRLMTCATCLRLAGDKCRGREAITASA